MFQSVPEVLFISIKGLRNESPLVKVAGFKRGGSARNRSSIPAPAGAEEENMEHPVVCSCRNGTVGCTPKLSCVHPAADLVDFAPLESD